MKLLWPGIKIIINNKSSSMNAINKLKDASENITSEPNVIANIFNYFFANLGMNVTQKIPRTMKSVMDYLRYNNEHSFSIIPATPMEVTDIISMLKSGNSIDPNSIPTKPLKILAPHISFPLSNILNESFQSGSFPTKMKLAKVIPLFKKVFPLTLPTIDQYLCCLCSVKLLKKICMDVFMTFWNKIIFCIVISLVFVLTAQ